MLQLDGLRRVLLFARMSASNLRTGRWGMMDLERLNIICCFSTFLVRARLLL